MRWQQQQASDGVEASCWNDGCQTHEHHPCLRMDGQASSQMGIEGDRPRHASTSLADTVVSRGLRDRPPAEATHTKVRGIHGTPGQHSHAGPVDLGLRVVPTAALQGDPVPPPPCQVSGTSVAVHWHWPQVRQEVHRVPGPLLPWPPPPAPPNTSGCPPKVLTPWNGCSWPSLWAIPRWSATPGGVQELLETQLGTLSEPTQP